MEIHIQADSNNTLTVLDLLERQGFSLPCNCHGANVCGGVQYDFPCGIVKSARSTALVEVSLQPKPMSISALISIANALKRAQMFMSFSLRSSVRSAVSMRRISTWELPCAFSLLHAASTLRVSAIWAVVRYVRMIVSSPSERKMACRVATVRSRSVSNVVYGSAACPRPFLGCDIVG